MLELGAYGGRYVPETLVPALDELAAAWQAAQADPSFAAELHGLLTTYVGRPTPLYRAERLRPTIYLKREDLNHTGAHKINNAVGQALLARYSGVGRPTYEVSSPSSSAPKPGSLCAARQPASSSSSAGTSVSGT